jgi:hypothetical protein
MEKLLMKKLLSILFIFFLTSGHAKVELSCAVVKLVDDNFFDTALTSVYTGDEDYASIEVRQKKNIFTIGGHSFTDNHESKVEISESNSGVIAKLTHRFYKNEPIYFEHSYINGKSFLFTTKRGGRQIIAWANCFCSVYDIYDGNCSFDPYGETPITW